MAGKVCPSCKEPTFFTTPSGRKCSKCGYSMVVSPNEGKGGRGQKCSNCSEYKVFNNKCSGCGAVYK